MAYYYLAAQLPYLVYGQEPPMSSAAFRELALSSLENADAAWLPLCVLSPPGAYAAASGGIGSMDGAAEAAPEFFCRWMEWEKALRLNLARFRAAKLKRDISFDAPDYPADAAAAAKTAAAMDSPLEAELFLDEARWKAVEVFQGIDYFDRNTMYAYLLKLLLLERRSRFKAGEGFTEYKGLYAAVMEAAGSGSAAGPKSQSGEPK